MEAQRESYPQIRVAGKSKAYARMILSNVGGKNSEMSAVSLYFYNHVMTDGDVSALFEKISITEMKHLEMFAETAKLLGADPRLWSKDKGKYTWWSPSFNKYHKNIKLLLENSLLGELRAIEKYAKQARIIKDPFIVELLNRIIEDEREHVDIFKSLIKNI